MKSGILKMNGSKEKPLRWNDIQERRITRLSAMLFMDSNQNQLPVRTKGGILLSHTKIQTMDGLSTSVNF